MHDPYFKMFLLKRNNKNIVYYLSNFFKNTQLRLKQDFIVRILPPESEGKKNNSNPRDIPIEKLPFLIHVEM